MKLKRIVSETSSCALLAVSASMLLVREAHAYLDPGTGSYILQILIAGLFGALFMLKVFWGRIVGFFSKSPSKSEATVQSDQDMNSPVQKNGNEAPHVQRAQSDEGDD